jgi:hypothetical protein
MQKNRGIPFAAEWRLMGKRRFIQGGGFEAVRCFQMRL